jgi:hypothetical protein
MEIISTFPDDVINNILSYDKHFIIRRGELINIIPKDDYRYNILQQRGIIKQKMHSFSMYDGFSTLFGDYYGECVINNNNGIETRIAVYEYPLLNKHIWRLYTYYPMMMISYDKLNVYI